tara:strand:+ start:1492 stop:1761 length:270 start_codon:yes stop_codon:yes gene_type:complete
MTQERIDLTKIETFLESAGQESGGRFVYDLIAELKRCYEEIDRLTEDCFRTAKLLTDNGVWLTEATLYESLKRYEKQLHLLEEARKASE